MRILQVNKFNYIRGGAERYFIEISDELRRQGHEVAVFSMQHPKNLPSPWSNYFVSRVSYNEPTWRDRLIAAGRMLYSFEAKRKFSKLLDDFKPDIIHAHNIYSQISPSILKAASQRNIPVVMHLHDYNLISPNRVLFSRGQIYERCLGKNYFRCVIDKCHKDSYAKSALAALTLWFHNSVLDIYRQNINLYIASSVFIKNKLIEGGFPEARITVLRNFADDALFRLPLPEKTDNYILYFGRLAEEKGIATAIRAFAGADSALRFKIVGDGPDGVEYRQLVVDLSLNDRVDFLPAVHGSELTEIIRKARAIVMPSIWYENMPLAFFEAAALGKTVIASRIGGLPEVIKDGETGFLFTPGNDTELRNIFNKLTDQDCMAIGAKARAAFSDHSLSNHCRQLLAIYDTLLAN